MSATATLRAIGAVPEDATRRLAAAARVDALSEVSRWGRIVEIVGQDEFTNDVIVDAGGDYLVFDTT